MARIKTLFVCQECGAQRPKWEGRCSDCGAWNSYVEEKPVTAKASPRGWSLGASGEGKGARLESRDLSQTFTEENLSRHSTGNGELDRVLGGGLVPGSYVLVGGDPGIGKSTLLMQMAGGLGRQGLKVLYVSGEESVSQTAIRAQRLGVREKNVEVASESLLENILDLAQSKSPDILVVDSIQTVYLSDVASAPGSVTQVRECAARLMALAKNESIAVFLVGHVTKEGTLAGPRVLEHMVDTVLSFEGDNHHQFRLLRTVKNRFGASNELGVFQMNAEGLKEVANPSEFFLEERAQAAIGAAVFAAVEGSRPLLCEIQGLVSYSPLSMPRRTAIGFDFNRLHLITAVMDRFLNIDASQKDIYVNVVGGLKISEPSADLAVVAALLSSAWSVEISKGSAFFGEVGLTGEVRPVQMAEDRIREAFKLGFKKIYLPASNRKHLKALEKSNPQAFIWVSHVRDLPMRPSKTKKAPPSELAGSATS
jgi:DNA repair protein RadA/Sms